MEEKLMNLFKKICAAIVSGGIPAQFPLGTVAGSLLAIPLLMAFRLANRFFPNFDLWLIGIFVFVALIPLLIVLQFEKDQVPPLVIDKIMGLLIAFIQIPFSLKLIAIGFGAYHMMRTFLPFLAKQLFNIDIYRMGTFVGILLHSCLAGLITNLLIRLALWIAR
jgi:hypothetical protein